MSLSILGWCPVNLNIPASKTGAFKIGLKTQNGNFLKLGLNDFDYILVIYIDHMHT
jgi:hypothetical protein